MDRLLKEIKGVFTPPKRFWYFGKIRFMTPYFTPTGYLGCIIKIRRLIPLSDEQLTINKKKGYGWAKERWSNMPMVRRCFGKEIKFLGNTYYVQIGWPWAYVNNSGSYKDKFLSPRMEWAPFKQIWFFGLQLHIGYRSPNHKEDQYWEQLLWWKHYCNKDLTKARKTWGWIDAETKESTWDNSIVIKK